ncbi:MAG: PolC-type DNA polymerase III [Lachnospiraceae bacterium]|nr:PolC-type DNA polymerase III [Lachnospiraceae bacterium]
MEKPFLEVFKALKLKDSLKEMFDDVTVNRVVTTKRRDLIKVYIESNHIISKKDIYQVSGEIRKQLFPGTEVEIRILEQYHLSDKYSVKDLLDEYWESMFYELSENAKILENCFKKMKYEEISKERIKIMIPDREIYHNREREILQYLSKVCCERFGLRAEFVMQYDEVEESNKEAWDEYRIQQLVNQTLANQVRTASGADGSFDGASEGALKAASNGEALAGEMTASSGDAASAGVGSSDGAKEGAAAERSFANTAENSSDGTKAKEQAASKPEKKEFKPKSDFNKSGFTPNRKFKTSRYSDESSDNPLVIYGREIDEEEPIIPIEDIVGEIGSVVIRGMITATDRRDIRNEKSILFIDVTDFTDTMRMKIFVKTEMADDYLKRLAPKKFIKVKGIPQLDTFDNELSIGSPNGIMESTDWRKKRMDLAPMKRVELHCHTKMSDMDGVSDASDLVKCAQSWGHKALAITDHGVVQGYTDAHHTWDALWDKEKKKRIEAGDEHPTPDDFFKVIYGVEGYLVDDLVETVTNSKNQSISDDTYVVFDIETTGFSPVKNKIIEIGAVKVKGGEIIGRFSEFVNPECAIPYRITKLTGIDDRMVEDAPTIESILPRFLTFAADSILVAHNASFDTSFIKANALAMGISYEFTSVDTIGMARPILKELNNYRLETVAGKLGVPLENHHRAVDDAECTAQIFLKLSQKLMDQGVKTLDELIDFAKISPDMVKKLPVYHIIILAKNNTGRVNMYSLVSKSHLEYFNKRPRIPKSEIIKHREGLIIGSACEAGELYRALLDERGEDTIARIVDFYDYLEVQPRGNNMFMVRDEKHANINSEEDILNINREIVKLGEMYNKPVVATCDVHFMNPEDEIYRRIIMKGQGFADADDQAPLYLHTTDEMLEEFGYLGRDKALEIVVTNPNAIADCCESISPVRPDKCPPIIENSDQTLTKICYDKAHEIYGPDLPEIVEKRLERELNSIITNGFAVMYIIAQKLVWKSVEDGYLVGSRGSVGSSFVATMSGITEVNPLVPHYYCSECHYYDFDSDEVKEYRGKAGVDMPDKACPVCGANLKKDGFDIPFETFLGFKGDKEPDIDLNFSGEYQSKAHKYTEVIFGAGQTFRAGTIASLADKTAYGYVKKYFEEKGMRKRDCEINRIVGGCVGVRRSTGQHPGGIIVLPVGEDINSFTPVQHPANDTETDTITTHFDYHSIDHNLLKLDILGHDDPTMIRMLQDLTGIDPLSIPLDDPKVMSLFENTEALGVQPSDILGCKLGCLGIPEFGTDFSMGMVIEAKPTCFSDLIRIAGLSHGTDVWLNNAQDLIRDGIATISTAICTRDDIMTYLINKGVESEESFKIMEMVRKGKVAAGKCDKWPQWKEDMRACDVPEWYIESCQKIKYMFPRAHAAAYVMMAWRIAYCKVYYPLAYYAAFFSIRAKAFNYETMCFGKEKLEDELSKLQKLEHPTPKDQDSIRDMRIVQEMYARGYEFMPIDLFRAQSRLFSVIDGKIMPSFTSVDGLGEKAADAIVEAAKDGPFLSKDNFRARSKASQTNADDLERLGILVGLPESDQISLFDML